MTDRKRIPNADRGDKLYRLEAFPFVTPDPEHLVIGLVEPALNLLLAVSHRRVVAAICRQNFGQQKGALLARQWLDAGKDVRVTVLETDLYDRNFVRNQLVRQLRER